MHEAALSQIHALSSSRTSDPNTGRGEYIDALVKARAFWYAFVQDGAINGLRGGRLLL